MGTEVELTDQNIRHATYLFGAAGFVLLIVLALVLSPFSFFLARRVSLIASAVFWGLLSVASVIGFWDLYYSHFLPAWSKRLLPFGFVLYVAFSAFMWFLASKLPGSHAVWFALLGGFEGVLEHLFGIRVLRILDKVPWLQGVDPSSILMFSFFEYLLYWTIVGWLAFGLLQLL